MVRFEESIKFHQWMQMYVVPGKHAVRRVGIQFSNWYEWQAEFVETLDGHPRYKRAKDSPALRKYL